jgi:hypothetical protein
MLWNQSKTIFFRRLAILVQNSYPHGKRKNKGYGKYTGVAPDASKVLLKTPVK